jgi:hypothetical protein
MIVQHIQYRGIWITHDRNEAQPYTVTYDQYDDEEGFSDHDSLEDAKRAVDRYLKDE